MSDFCHRIEEASRDLKVGSKPEEAAPLLEVLAEINQTRIDNSDLFKNRDAIAKRLEAKGVYSENVDAGIPGATGLLQQSDGKPNFLELVEGDRTETLRLDRNAVPMSGAVTQMCGGKPVTSMFMIRDGKRVLSSVQLPPALEIIMDVSGKPVKVKSLF